MNTPPAGGGSNIWTPQKPIANVNDACPPKSLERARLIINDPGIAFVTVQKITPGVALGDVALNFPYPCNSIMVSGCDPSHLTDSLYLHFKPLGKTYTTNTITPIGNENWFPLNSESSVATSKVGIGYRFAQAMPINSFLDIGQESGGNPYFITLVVGNNIDFWTRS
jgi:hypothetical protein